MKMWETKNLGDVCYLVGGGTPSKTNKEFYTGDIFWATVRDMKSEVISKTECQITEEAVKNSSTNVIPKGNVVIATRVGLGKVCILAQDTAINQDLRSIIPKDTNKIKVKYLFWWLKNISHLIVNAGTGATVQGVKVPFLQSLQIPLPPLPEQKRIVAILDEAFEGINAAIANTEKNLANARELFESYLNAVFTQKGEGWVEKKLTEIGGKVFTGPFGSLLHKADYIANGIPLINPANIENDEIVPNFNKTVSPDVIERLQSYVLSKNNIVIGRRGEIGRCAVVREEQSGWLCGSGSFFIKTFEGVNSDFLAHLFRSAIYRNQLEELSTGATMQNLSNKAISDLVIAMPPLAEQKNVIKKLDDLKAETQRLKSIYQRKLEALKELKQSILEKAFTGELTSDTPKEVTDTSKEIGA
ncbi:restriction endonuclease subunit S [Laspinema sp. A4]|uniref:restriction endonuclease subunit S n=1 Tax=Laspinema sp. D2d TaxID=2953686 RepID=UPI0021BB14D1|nr:restriction endonuclease subunit S [Laspinema sp. D2d]MCT7984511.1 restriction endonuclease subunit S [Laspinema sp. D2d]